MADRSPIEPAPAPATAGPFEPPPTDPASRRVQILAGLVFVALLVVVVLVLIGGRPKHEASASASAAQTRKLLAGLEQHGTTLGEPKAPVTIVELVDLQCPFCAAHQVDQQPTIINRVVRTGKARITIVPLAFLGADSQVGRRVFLRLAAKNHGWDFLNRAFLSQRTENSGYMTDAWLRAATSGIPGVTPADLARNADPTTTAAGEAAETLAKRVMKPGDGTPFFVVGPTSADPATYRKVDLTAKRSAAESIIAAAQSADRAG